MNAPSILNECARLLISAAQCSVATIAVLLVGIAISGIKTPRKQVLKAVIFAACFWPVVLTFVFIFTKIITFLQS